MNDLRPALRAVLLADAAVFSAVGGSRIFPVQMPQGEKRPSLVYHRVSGSSDYHMAGSSGLAQSRMQLDSVAEHAALAVQLANAVHDRLSGFKGTQDGVVIQGSFMVNEREDFDSTALLFRVTRDYAIWYMER